MLFQYDIELRPEQSPERVGAAANTIAALVAVYGPMAVEVFGLVEAPKPRRRAPVFGAGVAIGAGAMYLLNRKSSG